MRATAFIPMLFAATSLAAALNAPRGFEVVVRSDSAKIGTIEQRADRKGTVNTGNHPRDLETRGDRKGTVHTSTPPHKRDDDAEIVARGKGGGGKGDLDIAQCKTSPLLSLPILRISEKDTASVFPGLEAQSLTLHF